MGNITGRQMLRGKVTAIPRVDSTLSKEGQAADAKVTGEELNKRLEYTDVVNSLTAEDRSKPLSANMGKELAGLIENAKQVAESNLKQLRDEVDAAEAETQAALNTHTDGISENEKDIEALCEAFDKADCGKVFTYIGDGSVTLRVVETELNCKALLIFSNSSNSLTFVAGGVCIVFGYYTDISTIKRGLATFYNGALSINARTLSDGTEEPNSFLNENERIYTCIPL